MGGSQRLDGRTQLCVHAPRTAQAVPKHLIKLRVLERFGARRSEDMSGSRRSGQAAFGSGVARASVTTCCCVRGRHLAGRVDGRERLDRHHMFAGDRQRFGDEEAPPASSSSPSVVPGSSIAIIGAAGGLGHSATTGAVAFEAPVGPT